ncbi:MAG TPA: NADH-quinone oxidoreductase subunit K [bacterium]|nr:NADH-quinone oxidoreductase subunit K [bacterium]HOC89478.1 NADH-quinone oxidoreductase subunit K [bacterium]HOZ22912.1 NADH-quinone oxidoreductase subunit K [bacterium]
MITGQTLLTLTTAILITAMAAVEIRNLRAAAWAYLVNSVLLCLIIIACARLYDNEGLYLWAATCLLFKVVLIPWLLLRFIRGVPPIENKPIPGFVFSMVMMTVMIVVLFQLFRGVAADVAPAIAEEPGRSLLAGAATLFSLGIWTLLSRRDLIKITIGLALMENGVHLILLALAPQLKESTMIGILVNAALAVFILLYLGADVYRVFGTTDSARLSELKR